MFKQFNNNQHYVYFLQQTKPKIILHITILMQDTSISSMTDFLTLNKEPRLMTLLGPNEKIIVSCDVQKFNEVNKCQARILLVTDTAVYNILKNENFIKSMMSKLVSFQNKYSIRRKIAITNIQGITLSNHQENLQFILHVLKQHDYRLKANDYKTKMKIIKNICRLYQKLTKNRLAFYFTDEITLQSRCVQKHELKLKKMGKILKSNPVYLNLEDLIDYQLPGVSFQTLYCVDGKQKPINSFKSLGAMQLKETEQYYTIVSKKIGYQAIRSHFDIKHPFISLSDYVYKTNTSLYLLRPLYIGGRMDKLIQFRGALDKQMFQFYMAQLVLALEYLHAHNWIYSNLTLDNIYIKANGYITLEGLQKAMIHRNNSEQKLFAFKGRDKNLAPQVIYCDGYDHRIDMWQLGICAFIMLKGDHPFMSQDKKKLLKNILEKPIANNDKSIPSFVHKLLQKHPQNRIKDVAQLKKNQFFEHFDWKKLQSSELQAPYLPQIKSVAQWQGKMPSIVYIDEETN